jgi:hypothetical protein
VLTVGKTKERFVYEMVGDAANLPQVERLMSPVFVSRHRGLRFDRQLAKERMTLALGVYNDWFATDPTWDESGTTLAGRATLDKAGTTGHTNQHFTRVQWVY